MRVIQIIPIIPIIPPQFQKEGFRKGVAEGVRGVSDRLL
jgi:hypothetical protein